MKRGLHRRPGWNHEQLVSNNSEVGQWSPDGTRIALFGELGERLFNIDTGEATNLGLPDNPYPDLALFCGTWSPDGGRLAL